MDKTTALRELDRYRRLAKEQHEENEKLLKELHEAWNEKKGCEALLASILKKCGKVTISKEAVAEALRGTLEVAIKVDESAQTYTLMAIDE